MAQRRTVVLTEIITINIVESAEELLEELNPSENRE